MESKDASALNQTPLLRLLKEHFGFLSFRPLQEEIIRDALAGRDVVALLPTGGGKSLCFQLPALARSGLTVVVSPLIALMKDQVDALQANGIAATCLNSSLTMEETRTRLQGLQQGTFQLLYIAPERLMLPGFLNDLQGWNVNLLTIDEAHCISEWGHDFRPEYRRLVELRERFPSIPMMALTATATERVHQDILALLKLRDSASYVASFNRPNLTYRVLAKINPTEQVLSFLRTQDQESGIIYCQSRKTTELLAERLQANSIKAQPYHAGLTAKERTRHQELFLRDEVQVICATIAFGMGINKPNVRFVIHYDLPKNLESYYQETGRAGRDGLPSECLLLFSAGDAVKQQHFINEKPSLEEQQIARTQLQQMVQYAEGTTCRRAQLLSYFGENWPQEHCDSCDNCLSPRETVDGTEDACTVLSCIAQIRGKSGFGVGLNHVIEVLTGANTEKIRRWGHERLAAYGSGKNIHSRPEWAAICRELIRLGYLEQTTEPFTILELSAQGRGFLRERPQIILTKPMSAPERKKSSVGDLAHDETLFKHLRQLRKRLADERDVPAYVVFSDVALRQMARDYPTSERDFLQISGVGNRKLQEFGKEFLTTITEYVAKHPRQDFPKEPLSSSAPPPVSSRKKPLGLTVQETLKRFRLGDSVEHIAQQRGLVPSTIYGHLEQALQAGELIEVDRLLPHELKARMREAFAQTGFSNLTGAKEILGNLCDYGQLRLFRAIHGKTSQG
ncbi:DNA helicase RecQ [Candidatus Nitronereus thalassa]|uniref:DNA helicase RecQ n=1 Tax=Candidatus Nitronereus thalassa TaxID=3020898 RepID=A0ABU3K6I4_9BACT|nr:DNA helicase RecQ [Candidatus Nitronereus thalassa]MDT7042003.1 DNA helicase RecQ [Candidatus Nitronereus thalassa]